MNFWDILIIILGGIHPSEISNYNYDYIVVSNQYTKDRAEIKAQLMNMSIDMGKVIFLVENAELKEKVFLLLTGMMRRKTEGLCG